MSTYQEKLDALVIRSRIINEKKNLLDLEEGKLSDEYAKLEEERWVATSGINDDLIEEFRTAVRNIAITFKSEGCTSGFIELINEPADMSIEDRSELPADIIVTCEYNNTRWSSMKNVLHYHVIIKTQNETLKGILRSMLIHYERGYADWRRDTPADAASRNCWGKNYGSYWDVVLEGVTPRQSP